MRYLSIFLILLACNPSRDKTEEIVIVDTLKVSGTIYVNDSMNIVQNYTLYGIYNGRVNIQGETRSSNSKVIVFDSIKIGIPQGYENGYLKFQVKVNGIKETRTWICYGSTPDTFKVSNKVFSNVIIYANSCVYN
ncbi:MAG: hypothetical protein N2504_06475 [candidate division WOR-3 bacterium]|nr:hypothetical protein [candidate division WOR-3 bacterium]MCX7948214.1 hypothetical protein [candidate division WOR-3 bacterium]MDW8150016.1 hypothetical protein [candidate division WOR-3 bacterium]